MSASRSEQRRRPRKLWLIHGPSPAKRLKELPYSTDPRDYDLPGLVPMSDEEYAAVANRVRVFQELEHAADFCYECGFEWSVIQGYLLKKRTYHSDPQVTDELLDYPW